jgi:hypothetical protein
MNKHEKLIEMMRITGKGKMACEICLQLCGYDMEKTLERMQRSYPSMEVKK